ncbi:nonribosomal peptide synthetase MxcG [Saccharothrix tamanrassetensis]|uniref:Nonribosomal peptide synthetase MxcG n=1 Tax=Saccharothrix tamanrassetensis TaxID=1051531 RepID=A0A841CTI8_9PSEU|nr:condensation domain-containing protein [Saccharothrix tamanrassetensis]MBB5960610.1 nonribosomal peptide synthetase MxcG [Saccharothrix tamanrassetensis]
MTARTLPLSAVQAAIWFGQQLAPASPAYNTAEYVVIEGAMDRARLMWAVRTAVAEADSLHARFPLDQGQPTQVIEPVRDWRFPVLDLTVEADPFAVALEWMRQDVRTTVDLASGPLFAEALFELADHRWVWYQRVHHIALDGYAFSLLARRVADLYTGTEGVRFGSLECVADIDRTYRDSPQLREDASFWRDYLAGLPEPPRLAGRVAAIDGHALRCARTLSRKDADGWRELARAAEVGWPELVIAAVAAYLHRATGAHEVVLGLPVMGRLGTAVARVPAVVMNIVPVRVAVGPVDPLPAVAREVAGQLRRIRPHQRYRHEQLRRDLNLVGGDRALFGPVVNVMPFDNDLRFGEHRGRVHNLAAGPVEDLSIGVRASSEAAGLEVELDGNPALYGHEDLARHRDRLLRLLDQAVRDPDRPVGRMALAEVAVASRARRPPAPDVVDLIRRHAATHPDAVAIEQYGVRLTYARLIAEADELAGRLRDRGAGTDVPVALLMRRRPETVVAVLAVLIAGAAYVPLDPDAPEEHTRALLEATGSPITLGENGALAGSAAAQPGAATADRLAYIIHTSGSTGRPHGVLVSRAALAEFVRAATERYGITATDRVLQFAVLHFDASVEEVFLTLCAGATLVLRSEEMARSADGFLLYCDEARITVLDLPTAFWHELAHTVTTRQGLPASVRLVIIGGEAASAAVVDRWVEAVPHVRLINSYGPTEATVVACAADLNGKAVGAATVAEEVRR